MIKRIVLLFLSSLLLFGCAKHVDIKNDLNESVVEDEHIIVNEEKENWEKTIYAKDSFSNCGFTHYINEDDGEYKFEAYGNNDLRWDIYVLDSEWDDADRFIPQANTLSLKTDGVLYIEKGKYVYIQCPHNDFTDDAPLEDDFLQITK